MPISRTGNRIVAQTDTGVAKPTTDAPNIPDPYGGEGVVTTPVAATYQQITPPAAPSSVTTDSSVDPYDVQGSGETGAVVQQPATYIPQDINTPTGYAADAYSRLEQIQAAQEKQRIAAIVSGGEPSAPSPVGTEIRPETGFVSGSLEDKRAIAARDTTTPYGTRQPTQDEINRRRDYENIIASGGGYTDPNAPALDPYGVQADADRRDAASGIVQQTVESATADASTGTGGATGTGTVGGGGTGTGTGTGAGAGGAGGATGTSGDALFNQALSMRFEWSPDSDPNYQIAAKQAENQIANMMVGRGGLWSSVTQNALSNKLFELQAAFYEQAYNNFKDERAFVVDMAKLSYDREDEAWNRNMEMMKYQASRDDEMFSRSMRARSMVLQESKFAYEKEMAQAESQQKAVGTALNGAVAQYQGLKNTYTQMLSAWKSSGTASKAVAEYFGVVQGTNIASYTGSKKATAKEAELTSMYNQIMSTASAYQQDEIYLSGLNDFQQSLSMTEITGKDVMSIGTAAQASEYTSAKAALASQMAEADSDREAKAVAARFYNTLVSEASANIALMGENYYRRLISEVDSIT